MGYTISARLRSRHQIHPNKAEYKIGSRRLAYNMGYTIPKKKRIRHRDSMEQVAINLSVKKKKMVSDRFQFDFDIQGAGGTKKT